MSSLIILSFRSNKFHGSIQFQICLLVHLKFLYLSQNNISGTIPQCLNNLTAKAHKVPDFMTGKYFVWNGTEYTITNAYKMYISYIISVIDGFSSLIIIVGWKGNV